jgi:hypothetical protein
MNKLNNIKNHKKDISNIQFSNQENNNDYKTFILLINNNTQFIN